MWGVFQIILDKREREREREDWIVLVQTIVLGDSQFLTYAIIRVCNVVSLILYTVV